MSRPMWETKEEYDEMCEEIMSRTIIEAKTFKNRGKNDPIPDPDAPSAFHEYNKTRI